MLSRLDRYIFVELLGPFGFFALVITGILWLLQSLRLVDRIISSNESAVTFLEFSSLILPNVMMFVIPLATFAAVLYLLNKLYTESELVVMLMSGHSPWSVLKPLLIFSATTMLAMYVITLYLMPVSTTRLNERQDEIRTKFANSLIVEGSFKHPADGVTFFIEDTNTQGEMRGLFLHDARNAIQPTSYAANRAALVNDKGKVLLVMFDGAIQEYDAGKDTIRTVAFDRLAFDLTSLSSVDDTRVRRPREYFVHEALAPTDDMLTDGRTLSKYLSEAHEKISLPILVLTLPMLALGGVLAGSFRRGGLTLRMTISVALMIFVQLLAIVCKGVVAGDAALWPVAYFPAALSAAIGTGLIFFATRVRASRSQRTPV